jgi:magnesium chelatase family protein
MSVAIVHCRASLGIKAPKVTVETHISNGMPAFAIVGLPETAVKESRDRVRSALLNSQFEFPAKRITVNLAPADLPKNGARFDLAIALSILAALGQIPQNRLDSYEFAGELALTGELRPVAGILPFAIACEKNNKALIIPQKNAYEAQLISKLMVYCADSFTQVCAHLTGQASLSPHPPLENLAPSGPAVDLAEVKGQQQAKRALEITAAGGHNLLFTGPPGTGKSMLAARLPSLMPKLSENQALTVAAIQSISSSGIDISRWRLRPFRAPHHTASSIALVGGGSPPRPGEISLAHQGILFLDELAEFNRHVLEALREPLESGRIIVSRAARQAEFPAAFQLIAAMNPCPCGYLGDAKGCCRCTEEQIKRYQNRISGPLLDRLDLHIEVKRQPYFFLQQAQSKTTAETSFSVRQRVTKARQFQYQRQQVINAHLQGKALEQHCILTGAAQQRLQQIMEKFDLSPRAYYRMLRVARTIADLAAEPIIAAEHILEALNYRSPNATL